MAVPVWLLKTAANAARHPEKTTKAVLKVVIGILIVICFLSALMMELISCFMGNLINDDFDVYAIDIFQNVSVVHEEVYDEIEDEIEEIKEKLIEENTHTVGSGETAREVCDIEVKTTINHINWSYSLAYINYTESEVHRWKTAAFDKDTLHDFLRSISKIHVSDRIDDVYYIWNENLSAEEAADLYFADDSKTHSMYLASFDLYVSFLNTNDIVTDESWEYIDGELQVEEITREGGVSLPQYYQNDYKHVRYGNGTISSSGCAPTSIAMVISGLTGKRVTPEDVVKWTGNKYYVSGQGSSWSIFSACAKNWGVSCNNLGKSQKNVIAALQAGKPVIASMGPKTFTKGGHIIVLRGVTMDGYFLVNDPNKKNFKKYGTDKFKTSVVFSEAKNFWSFG
ncbi:MAG: C39 family peptidase [Lachnospiraceae bacterium]|nr:C39 family peptidase [Lachnospiraceae bacterium]